MVRNKGRWGGGQAQRFCNHCSKNIWLHNAKSFGWDVSPGEPPVLVTERGGGGVS